MIVEVAGSIHVSSNFLKIAWEKHRRGASVKLTEKREISKKLSYSISTVCKGWSLTLLSIELCVSGISSMEH